MHPQAQRPEPSAGIYLKLSEADGDCSRRTQESKKIVDKTKMVLSKMKKGGKPVRPGDMVKMTGLDRDEVSKILSACLGIQGFEP